MTKILLISFILLFVGCTSNNSTLVSVEGQTMGTYYRIKTFTDKSPDDVKKDADKFLKLFNDIFSTYIPTSEISKLNQTKFDRFKVSRSMGKLLDVSIEIFRKSGGYFDITVGPLVNAWGFGPDGKRKKPTDKEIKDIMEVVGSHHIELKKNFLHLKKQGIYVDMSAIAKGFGIDELVKHLEYNGHKNFMVEIGGEVRARGQKPDGKIWTVGIEGPAEQRGQKIVKVVKLKNLAMATSGNYRNFLKYGDEIFSHTIDPKTGYPSKHKTVSVTVIHEYCADADAWATALMSMGPEKGMDIANKNDLMAFFQVKGEQGVEQISTTAFDKYIKSM